jgi:hypothetical protein
MKQLKRTQQPNKSRPKKKAKNCSPNNSLSKKEEQKIAKFIKNYNKYVTEIVASVMEFEEWYVRSQKEKIPESWKKYLLDVSKLEDECDPFS